jgi:hypothetical protein
MSTEGAESPNGASVTLRRVQEALEANPDAIVMVLPDEIHRRRLQKAVEKQIKNATAARGQMSSLDDANDPHLGDVIRTLENCERILINTRPAENQLDNTPLGAALDEAKKGTKGKRGGEPKKVGEVLAERGDQITWADTVPEPRPNPGTAIVSPAGAETEVREAIGYDPERNAFRVVDSDDWDGFVFFHEASGQWRLLGQALEYEGGASPAGEEAGDSGVLDGIGAADGESGEELEQHEPGTYADSETEPDTPPVARAERARAAAKKGGAKGRKSR